MQATRRGSRRRRRLVRYGLLALIVVLYVVSVPWYRDSERAVRIVLGLPDWVATALACYVGVAFCNAAAWLLSEVPESIELSAQAGTETAVDGSDGCA